MTISTTATYTYPSSIALVSNNMYAHSYATMAFNYRTLKLLHGHILGSLLCTQKLSKDVHWQSILDWQVHTMDFCSLFILSTHALTSELP